MACYTMYGIDISNIKINEGKAREFIEEIGKKEAFCLESWQENKADNDEDYTFEEWVSEWSDDRGGYGIEGFLAYAINLFHDIGVIGDSGCVGICANFPWTFTDAAHSLDHDSFCSLLSEYVHKISDDEFEFQCFQMDDSY